MTTHHDQKQLRKIHHIIIQGSQDRNTRQELRQMPWRNVAYWLAPCGLLLFSHIIQDYLLRHGTAHSGWGPHTSIVNQGNAQRTCLQASLMEAFSQDSLFPDMSRFMSSWQKPPGTAAPLTHLRGAWKMKRPAHIKDAKEFVEPNICPHLTPSMSGGPDEPDKLAVQLPWDSLPQTYGDMEIY